MKKIISVLISFSIIFCSLCLCSYAADTYKYSVDAKPGGTYVQGNDKLNIKGWAFDTSGKTVRCYYKIDSGSEIAADPVTRNDVKAAFPSQCSQLDCGFDQYISVDNLSFGTHKFYFYAKNGKTTKTLCETSFTVIGIKSDCNQIPSGTFSVDGSPDFTVIGWAFSSTGDTTDCYYQIDSNPEVFLPHVNRSDVQSVFGASQLDCGFNYRIPASEFSIGNHTLKLIARCGSVSKVIGSSEVKIQSPANYFRYSCDVNLKDTYGHGSTTPVRVSGWAFATNGSETRCYYQIDNGEQILLTPHARADVMNAYPTECFQSDSGYQADLSIADLSVGVHTYTVIAKSGSVSQVIKQTEFSIVEAEGVFKAHSEHILEGEYNLGSTDTALIKGWGFITSGQEVKFYGRFDNGPEFYLTTEERTDVESTQTGCYRADCGYIQYVYLGNLSAGTHTCSVILRTADEEKVAHTSTFTIVRPVYTVSFNANGGTGSPAQMTKTFGKNLELPAAEPVRDYYSFVGWSTTTNESGLLTGSSYTENANAVLYAIWEHEEFELQSSSALSFDAKDNLIYGESLLSMTADELKNNFANSNKAVSDSKIVTGTEISISDSQGVYDTAQAVILGDVNCDGNIDGMDAVCASCAAGRMLDKNTMGKAAYSAADCLRNGRIDIDDIEKLQDAGVMRDSVNQNSVPSRGYYDTEFTIPDGTVSQNSISLNADTVPAQISSGSANTSVILNAACDEFNFYGIRYSSSTYAEGTVSYSVNGEICSEQLFLEPAENGEFFSFIDGVFDGIRSTELISFSFTPRDAETFDFTLLSIGLFNREVPETVTYIENDYIKIGLNMNWGGALSYYEDLDSNVQAVSDSGIIRIDTNAAQRYGTESLNNNVNLINCHDTGRLVQQSYYGTTNYDMGFFDGHYCAYNPVQGGNMYNESSKIVDIRIEDNSVYVKCRPLDWAKAKEYITESYMEATYTLCDDTLKTQCRFVDFSGYDPEKRNQELPAFYGAATMDNFVYYKGNSPWTDGELSSLSGLDEYLYAHYPAVYPDEQWGAFTGEFDDSFSMGLYVPDCVHMLVGVSGSVTAQTENPDTSNSTSYLAGGREMTFQSFDPIEYDFYITTGTVDEVRNTFKSIHES